MDIAVQELTNEEGQIPGIATGCPLPGAGDSSSGGRAAVRGQLRGAP